MTSVELVGILVVVAVVIALCLRLAWEHIRHLVRRGDRYEPLGEIEVLVDAGSAEPGLTFVRPEDRWEGPYAVHPGEPWSAAHLRIKRELAAGKTPPAFRWPEGRAERREGDRELGVRRG